MVSGRRRALRWIGVSLVALGAVVWTRRRGLVPWLANAALADEPMRPLRAATAECLRAVVVALLDPRVETGHYLEFFRWRAEHVPGAAALYERFALALDREVQRRGAHRFASAPAALQRALVARYGVASGVERVRRTLFDRDAARVSRHVVRQVYRRFAATDAWVLAGYAAWPGMPRAVARLRPVEPRP